MLLDQIIEKVLTLNVNANTNIDVQAIIEKYVLYTQASKVIIALLGFSTIIITVVLIYKAWMKSTQVIKLAKIVNEAIDRLKEINKYDFTTGVKESLKEILEYMPRNKKKRKL